MKNIRYCSFPSTPKDALAGLLAGKNEAFAVAGGTLAAKTLPDTTIGVVDLKKLPLGYIRQRGADLVIGATATFDDIDRSPLAGKWAGGAISAAASRCSSQLIRNMATFGGNIARPHSFNIFPAVLLGLDARVRVLSRKGTVTVPFSGIYGPDFKLRPGRDCLILEAVVPGKTKNWTCRFEKFARTEASWEAYLSLFMAADVKGGVVKEARISLGALSPKPFRAPAAERVLSGAKLTREKIAEAAAALKLDMDAARADDFRKSAAAGLLEDFLGGIRPKRETI